MNTLLLPGILVLYFLLLLAIAYFTSKNATSHSFFTGDKKSPWYLVAFGMIGTSLSGVTFVSVPGSVSMGAWHYYQLVLGFFAGYSYWFPKFFGFKLDEKLGKYAFWCWFFGFLIAFVPLYIY